MLKLLHAPCFASYINYENNKSITLKGFLYLLLYLCPFISRHHFHTLIIYKRMLIILTDWYF